ncbi:MAG TPA: ribonuclease P protein component [Blastocatellia bacterium]|nr:ribonuclease P protein component [Blastocatellia bacterium]
MPDEKLRKTDRILKREVFRRVYDQGRKYQGRYFTAFVLSGYCDSPRIGITVTRKVGNSVKRNRCRRLVREVFRRNKAQMPAGISIVLNVKDALLGASLKEIEADLLRAVGKSR